MIEDRERGEVVGTATIRAQAGAVDAYYTYRQETLIHASQQLNVRREVQTLSLSHEVSEATLLCALSLDPRYKGTSAESLLRRARLMFIAQYPERFADLLAVAFPGLPGRGGRVAVLGKRRAATSSSAAIRRSTISPGCARRASLPR